MTKFRIVLSAIAISSSTLLAQAQDDPIPRFQAVADRWVKAFNARDYNSLQADFDEQMLKDFPLSKSVPFYQDLAKDIGKVHRLDPPRFIPPNQALFHAHGDDGDMDIRIFLNNENKISGLRFLPPTPELPVPSRNATRLSLPFRGDWRVAWGGDTAELNHHHDVPNQRFAFDFVGVDSSGATHKGDGTSNEDYFAFGREVIAPADGRVVEVIDGVRDNVPGSMNPYSAVGNAIILRHAEHEYSVLAHLKLGSIRVHPDDEVQRGQVLALCGNSGNSSEPHLHYHLQNSAVLQNGIGIKVFFDDAGPTGPYSPIKGDRLSAGKN